jgi:homocysteine S-methyltransferase
MTANTRFRDALASDRALVLDGGLATELEAQGHDISSALWSAHLLHSQPQAIVAAHLAFLEAGADIIISASYQASRAGFMSLGLSAFAADELIASSVQLAASARSQFLARHRKHGFVPLVAASVGPYGATLHDGAEYHGDYGISMTALEEFHTRRLQLLDDSGADLLACETIPDHQEAQVLQRLLDMLETPSWVSFSCRDERHISDGTPLRDMAALFANHHRVLALGINCSQPQLITPLIGELRAGAPGKAVVVYPNSGENWQAGDNRWHGVANGVDHGVAARAWREAGARVIGGCCRVTPAHISGIRKALDQPISS